MATSKTKVSSPRDKGSAPPETMKNTEPEITSVAVSEHLPKRWATPLLLLVAVLVIALCLLFLKNMGFGKFRTVAYNNGQGYSFKMKFYSKHYVSTDYNSTVPANVKGSQGNNQLSLQALASKVSVNNKYPVWFSISADKVSKATTAQYKRNNGSTCGQTSTIFTVHNKNVNQDITMCNFSLITDRSAYVGTFIYKDSSYTIIVTQVADKKELSSPDNAKRTGLADYQADLKTIIGSIKPL